jgi:eukaryotic-like serine/threonine-protein kinase
MIRGSVLKGRPGTIDDPSMETEAPIEPVQTRLVTPGTVVAGRYRILRTLGSGSFSHVFEATDTVLGQTRVAVKLFTRMRCLDAPAVAVFGREVLAMTRVNHPNVVRLLDVIVDGDLIGYSMELIRGSSLQRIHEGSAPLNLHETVSVLVQICRGAEGLYESGLVHRDLKPANVMVSESGKCKIVALGIALTLGPRTIIFSGENEGSLRGVDRISGTIDYMSPEMLLGRDATPAEDVYSIGMIGYEMVTGSVAFGDLEWMDALRAKVNEDPPAPREVNAECPAPLSDLNARAVCRHPELRYPYPEELLDDLESCRTRLLGIARVEVISLGLLMRTPRPRRPCSRSASSSALRAA